MPTISPKASMWINIAIALLGLLAAGTLPSYVPPWIARDIAETTAWLIAPVSAVNAALHGLSAPQRGPLVPPTSAERILP